MKTKSKLTTAIIACLLLCTVIFLTACNKKGDYQYIIYMKDGTKVEAWNVIPIGGGLSVTGKWGYETYYQLSSDQYIRADYVGVRNSKK